MKTYNIPAGKPLLVWHFLKSDYTTASGGIKTKVGKTYSVNLPLEICTHGLHASRHPLDALGYSQGPVITLCEVWGEVQEQEDKLCAQFRRPLWAKDATLELHEFACRCAEVALCIGEVEDERSWNAIVTKRAWLRGEISDGELAAARAAARDAAWDAAWDAARAAARDAARDAFHQYLIELMPEGIRNRYFNQ